ncbi:lysozyme inhibitor LprI family protein [Acinetobacter defluvii]|uniref:lysozyme inhibitor LprI family protein n=1 Tax=Acinetobacter defluvii TaxID=1871111 RepID=UPI003AF5FBC5
MKQLLILPLLIISFTAHALCENERKHGNTVTINNCYDKEVKKSDQKILQVYSRYKNTLNAHDQKQLLDLQRTWISYKTKQCKFEVSNGGTIAGQLSSQCMINLNNRRIMELQYMQDCGLESSSNFCTNYRPA